MSLRIYFPCFWNKNNSIFYPYLFNYIIIYLGFFLPPSHTFIFPCQSHSMPRSVFLGKGRLLFTIIPEIALRDVEHASVLIIH